MNITVIYVTSSKSFEAFFGRDDLLNPLRDFRGFGSDATSAIGNLVMLHGATANVKLWSQCATRI